MTTLDETQEEEAGPGSSQHRDLEIRTESTSGPHHSQTHLRRGGKAPEDGDVLGPVDGEEEHSAGRLRGVETRWRGEGEGGDGGGEDVEHLRVQLQGVDCVGGCETGVVQGLLELVQGAEHEELLLVVVVDVLLVPPSGDTE